MRSGVANLVVAGAIAAASLIPTPADAAVEHPDLNSIEPLFAGYEHCMVLSELKTGEVSKLNAKMSAERVTPVSTFKIFNACAGLESGALTNEMHTFDWDGTKYDRPELNRDQTLQNAITNSTVWYFQRVASGVGEERMKDYLHKVGYGNEDISGGLTKFWLGSSLKISADEQVEFLKKLVREELPFSKRNMAIVRGLIRLKETSKGVLYGKTGSDRYDGKNVLGWFVGYVAAPNHVYVFATLIRAEDNAWGYRARQITEAALEKLNLF